MMCGRGRHTCGAKRVAHYATRTAKQLPENRGQGRIEFCFSGSEHASLTKYAGRASAFLAFKEPTNYGENKLPRTRASKHLHTSSFEVRITSGRTAVRRAAAQNFRLKRRKRSRTEGSRSVVRAGSERTRKQRTNQLCSQFRPDDAICDTRGKQNMAGLKWQCRIIPWPCFVFPLVLLCVPASNSHTPHTPKNF